MIGFDNEFSAFVFSAEPPQKRRGTSHLFTLTNACASVKNGRGPCCAIANPGAGQLAVEKLKTEVTSSRVRGRKLWKNSAYVLAMVQLCIIGEVRGTSGRRTMAV